MNETPPLEDWTDGRYTMLEPLGQGSFGVVWKARQRSTGRLVALKVARTANGADGIARLHEEIRLGAALSHPNLARLVDSGVASGTYYAAFDFVPGATLRETLRTESRLAPSEATHLMRQVLDALRSAHDRGIVHCDLKPENIMITPDGGTRNAVVLDFGLACVAAERGEHATLTGTPSYAAPEQLRGVPPAPSCDLYAWGLVFLECLTGEPPALAAHGSAVARLGSESVAIPSWLRRLVLGRVIEIATTRDPATRAARLPRLLELLAVVDDGHRSPATANGPLSEARNPGGATDGVGARRLTPLAGRAAELARLGAGWSDAIGGRGRAFVIVGDPGIGKTRLIREIRRRCAPGTWIELRCAPENRTTPLQPVIDALLTWDDPLEERLDRYQLDRASHFPLFAALLRQPPDPRYPPLNITPDRQKDLTLRALLLLLRRRTQGGPFMLVVENLHWADPTTLELVQRIIEEYTAAGSPSDAGASLILCTTRPDGVPTLSGGGAEHVVLHRLSDGHIESIVRSGTPETGIMPAVMARIVERAEGNPLFAEELTTLLSDPTGSAASDTPGWPASVVVPSSVHELLTARLDLVSVGARETAQLAATLGREFAYEILAASSPDDRSRLDAHLVELTRAGLVHRRGEARLPTCTFRHALLRDAVYDATPPTLRRRLHHGVAQVLRARFPELAERRPEIVATHFEHAGEVELALEHWLRAANDSYRRAAYSESLTQSEHALALAGREPAVGLRPKAVDLLVARGTALFSLQGWAAPEVEETFAKAWRLAIEPGSTPPPQVLYGVWGVHIVRSDRAGVSALIPHLEQLATRTDDDIACHLGESCLGIAAFWRGDFPTAIHHLRRALGRYGAQQRDALYDSGIYSYVFGFCALWTTGRLREAFALRDEAFAVAERRADPYSLSAVLAFASMMAHDCGEVSNARNWSLRLMQLAEEQHLYAYWAPGAVAYGRALLAEGRYDEALDTIRIGLERYRVLGLMASYGYYHYYLAIALLEADRDAEAATAIAGGLELCRSLYARFHEPELVRLRGRIELRRGERQRAEQSFRAALALAEAEGALAFELRAAIDLAELEGNGPHARDARTRLARVHARIDDVDTADMRAARALLAADPPRRSAPY